MRIFLISLIAIFFILIIFFIYRLSRLIKSRPQASKDHKKEYLKLNKVNAGLLLGFGILGLIGSVWITLATSDQVLPGPVSVHGEDVDRLFYWTLGLTGFVFFLTEFLLFYFSWKYRHTPSQKAYFFPIDYKLEFIWTIIPALTFIGLNIMGFTTIHKIMDLPPEDAVVVEILGQQYSWMVRYPGPDGELGEFDFRYIDPVNHFGLKLNDPASFDDFMPMQMYLPVNRSIELKIRSRDVIHSVFLPYFRVKMDAVPGMPTRFNFIPTKTTEEMRAELEDEDFDYELACTELCGRGHFAMRFIVKVIEQEEFDAWYEEQESWLAKNPSYLENVPTDLRELAQISMK